MKILRTFILRNPAGSECEITNCGAKLMRLVVPNTQGEKKNIVFGFNTLEGQLSILNEKIWEIVGQSAYSVSLHYRSRNGEDGFPGTMDIYLTYQLMRDNRLAITLEAKSDQATPCAFTHHACFNLNGEDTGRGNDHTLTVHSDRNISDQHWYFDREGMPEEELCKNATLSADGRTMEVWSNMPSVKIDTHHAVCVECRPMADEVNSPEYPSVILHPGEVYYQKIEFRFS